MQLKQQSLNRKASNPKSKPDKTLETLNLSTGQVVADVGAGGGYFTFRFAEIVGKKGKVFAIDTNPDFLNYIEGEAKKKGLENVQVILAKKNDFALPKKVDLVLMRNICHHLKNRQEYFEKLKKVVKEDGIVAIIEYRKSRHFSLHDTFKHYVPKKTLIEEMQKAGYWLVKDLSFLPDQSFTIYAFY